MKKYLKMVGDYIRRSKALKYVVVVVIAVIIIGIVDENSVWSHFRNKARIHELKSEIRRYKKEHEYNQAQIRQLDSNPKAIEKIARERYFMKTDDEDIFVLSDDPKQSTTLGNETTE